MQEETTELTDSRPSIKTKTGETLVSPLLERLEAATFLRISVRSLDTLTRTQALRHVRLGSRLLYRHADLLEFIDSRTTTKTATKTPKGAK